LARHPLGRRVVDDIGDEVFEREILHRVERYIERDPK
jgi:hypothetical protein